MNNLEKIKDLKKQSTWMLLLFSFFTFGVYIGHYAKTQVNKLNLLLDDDQKINTKLTTALVALLYISVAIIIIVYIMSIVYIMTFSLSVSTDSDKIQSVLITFMAISSVSNLVSLALVIILIVTSFKIRNRMNTLMDITKVDENWLNAFWTFFLHMFYINYKINKMNKQN
jgi:heme/copper-type cytochrome/quinol oxidase subunit 2